MENLLFAPRAVADEARAIRTAIEGCHTWGEARKSLSEEQYGRLVAEFRAPAAGAPGSDEPLGNVSDWPCLLLYQMSDEWLPEEIFSRFGDSFDGALASGSLLPAHNAELITGRLEEIGFTVTWDEDLEDLFDLNHG